MIIFAPHIENRLKFTLFGQKISRKVHLANMTQRNQSTTSNIDEILDYVLNDSDSDIDIDLGEDSDSSIGDDSDWEYELEKIPDAVHLQNFPDDELNVINNNNTNLPIVDNETNNVDNADVSASDDVNVSDSNIIQHLGDNDVDDDNSENDDVPLNLLHPSLKRGHDHQNNVEDLQPVEWNGWRGGNRPGRGQRGVRRRGVLIRGGVRVRGGDEDDSNVEMPCTERIPASLMSRYLNKNHVLFTDNFYTSPSLAEYFLQNGTHLCGTIRSNRKHFCKDIVDVPLEKGKSAFYRSTNNPRIIVGKYRAAKDKASKQQKIVYLLSTCHAPKMINTEKKTKEGETIQKPSMIKSYNSHMSGVDMVDQQLHGLQILRKTYKWYKKLALRLISQVLLNSHKLFQISTGKKNTFLEFLRDVIADLSTLSITHHNTGPDNTIARLHERHFPSIKIASENAKHKRVTKNCRVCYARGKRSDKGRPLKTVYVCGQCPDEPALHVEDCFRIYHTVKDFHLN